jgi:hypothetical protein
MGGNPKDPRPGQAHVLSFFKQGLFPGTYVVDVQQPVTAPGSPAPVNLQTTKTIHVKGLDTYQLPPGALHSCYPGEGEAVESRILPHVVLSDPHIPWELSPDGGGKVGDALLGGAPVPWLGLLVFTADELSTFPSTSPGLMPSATLTVGLSKKQLQDFRNAAGGPRVQVAIPDDELATNPEETINTIFVNSAAFRAHFASQTRRQEEGEPAIAHFSYLAHVRRSLSTKAWDASIESFGIVLGHRAGPLDIQAPVKAYAHLVSLRGIWEHLTFPPSGASDLTAMVSLYSWTFSWVPDSNAEIRGVIKNLSEQVRPMARTIKLSGSQNKEDADWLTKRMESGYTFVKHRLPSGETAPALFRGPLIPQRPHGNERSSAEATNHGSGLQIIDSTTGLADISYSVAWNLGRSLAIDNTGFLMALSALRSKLSHICRTTLMSLEQTPLELVAPSLPDWLAKLRELARDSGQTNVETQPHAPAASVGSRWRAARNRPRASRPTVNIPLPDPRAGLAAVREMLDKEIQALVDDKVWYARELSEPTETAMYLPKIVDFIYNELLTLRAVPHNYLFPEPDILDTEAVQTFYTDPLWLDALVDGALSVGNHQALDGDTAKNEIKRAVNSFVAFSEGEQWRRRLPVWGAVVCGKVLRSFGDPRVFTGEDPETPSPELLATTRLHENALLLLFNCRPEGLPYGLTISQPPHQQRFAAATVLKPTSIRIDLPGVPLEDADKEVQSLEIPAIEEGSDSEAIDFTTRCLKPSHIVSRYARAAKDAAQGRNAGSFDELGSSALLSLALGDKLLELVVRPTEAQAEAGRGAPLSPFQLHVQEDQDAEKGDAEGGGAASDSRNSAWLGTTAPPPVRLERSAGSMPLGYRRVASPEGYREKNNMSDANQGGVLDVARLRDPENGPPGQPTSLLATSCRVLNQCHGAANGRQYASLLVHIKAGEEALANSTLSHVLLHRVQIALPSGALLAPDSTSQPTVRVLGRAAGGGWSAGSGHAAIWPPLPPPPNDESTAQDAVPPPASSGPAFVVELTSWVATAVRDVDIQILLGDVAVSATAGKDVLLDVVEEYAVMESKADDGATTRVVAKACAVDGLTLSSA